MSEQGTTLSVRVSDDKMLRMVVLGASRTGKTQIMSRFMGEKFSDVYIPTIDKYHRKMYTIRGRIYQLDIVETSGMSHNHLDMKMTLMTGDVFLIVYSITDAASFESAKETAKMIERLMGSLASETKQHHNNFRHWNCRKNTAWYVPIILAGNKCDLEDERAVTPKMVSEWMQNDQPEFSRTRRAHVELSAKDASSVQRLFETVFSTAHLPLEMSPSMHRKMSTNTFLANTSKVQRRHHEPFSSYFRGAGDDQEGKKRSPILGRRWKSAHSTENAPSVQEQEETSLNAFATVCLDQRRPSAATEVTLAMKKARHTHQGHYLPKDTFSPFQKLKKTLGRVSSSHI